MITPTIPNTLYGLYGDRRIHHFSTELDGTVSKVIVWFYDPKVGAAFLAEHMIEFGGGVSTRGTVRPLASIPILVPYVVNKTVDSQPPYAERRSAEMTVYTHPDYVVEKTPSESEHWKNRYLATKWTHARCVICGKSRDYDAGEDFLVGCCVDFPSKEAAEKDREQNIITEVQLAFRYLGPIRL